MEIKVSIAAPTAVLSMGGRFDFNAHRAFKEAYDPLLQQKEITSLELNLAGVQYLDSSALGMLLMLRDKARGAGRNVSLANCRGAVKQVIEIANFSKLFAIV